jgi:hypothetical protein
MSRQVTSHLSQLLADFIRESRNLGFLNGENKISIGILLLMTLYLQCVPVIQHIPHIFTMPSLLCGQVPLLHNYTVPVIVHQAPVRRGIESVLSTWYFLLVKMSMKT